MDRGNSTGAGYKESQKSDFPTNFRYLGESPTVRLVYHNNCYLNAFTSTGHQLSRKGSGMKKKRAANPTIADKMEMIARNPQEALKYHISAGNSKLPKYCAIYNLGSAKRCPSRYLGLCKVCSVCYARKAEIQYPACLPYRERQASLWHGIAADDFVSEFVEINSRKRTKFTELRFNESGDFWSQDCINKMEQIAKLLTPYGITVYTYTARQDLNFSDVHFLTVNGSGFMVSNKFTAVKSFTGNGLRCLGDCSKCNFCKVTNGMEIEIEIH